MLNEKEPVFRRGDGAAFGVTFALTLAAYVATLAPTVTLEDCGELATASTFLGVPHPPGYPSWTLITWLFTKLFSGASYLGHPNPAWAVAFASAFFGALTCGVLALLISSSGRLIADGKLKLANPQDNTTIRYLPFFAGVGGGLLLAFSPVLWSQSTIVEVYALNGFFQTTILALLYRWLRRPAQNWPLFLLCFLFGLGVTNHQTLLFLGPALAVAVLVRDLRLFRDFLIVGLGLLLVVFFNIWLAQQAHVLTRFVDSALASGNAALAAGLHAKQVWYAQAQWLAGPWSDASPARNVIVATLFHLTGANINPAFWIYMLLAVTIPLAGLWLPHGRKVCASFLLIEMGLAFYFLMPIFSAHNPPINWGYPRTWEGFLSVITRGQYNAIQFADIFSSRFLAQVGHYLGDLRNQFTLPVVLAGLLPFCGWSVQVGARRWRAIPVAVTLIVMVLPFVFGEMWLDDTRCAVIYQTLAAVVVCVALTGCGLLLYRFVTEWLAELHQDGTDKLSRIIGLFLLAGGVALVVGADVILLIKTGRLLVAGALAKAALALALVLVPPIMVLAFQRLAQEPFALRYDLPSTAQRWLLVSVVAFLSLSVLFISFANTDVDLQTQFIVRVQFVQSHSTFALWLGYGLLLALAHGRRRVILMLGVAAAALAPLTLVYQNYFDTQQLRAVGGAEMNGHDFGWQFGAGALDGMVGLRATLQPGEPPPPNPQWPPPMERNAIYLGGTDPGRFVPTYMVFCARVRPDVFVLTQNALLEKLYLAPLRDLYGRQIALPSAQDAERMMRTYVADIEQGRVRNRGEVSFDDGYARLVGRKGAMAVNGVLARTIFEANKARHAFYIEESDVMEWMYPYLMPHGLIMKLNPEPLATLPPEISREDRAFWDWQTRRLLGDERVMPDGFWARLFPRQAAELRGNWRYRHDAVAQKVFTKLRCAIGGIYASRKMYAEAEYAFRQAIQLYPVGPEAYFRLTELFLAQERFAEARHATESLLQQDAHLTGAQQYLRYIAKQQQDTERRKQLEHVLATESLTLTHALELAEVYGRLNQETNFVATIQRLLSDAGQPTNAPLAVAQFLVEHKRFDLLPQAFERHLQQAPRDVNVWVEYAAFRLFQNQTNAALELLRTAVKLDAPCAREQIRGDARFQPLQKLPEFQQLVTPQAVKLDSFRVR
ncbi:MAG: DUF2723 domain-containing protein [Verrucomicrobia bacterium]|nr:MAG: DUF2723 domain-containing protein [Verrucomicrobiota bacterium]